MEKIIRHGNRGTCRLDYDKAHREMAYFTFAGLEQTGIVDHFFSTRYGGVSSDYLYSLNFSYAQGDIKEHVDENFRRAAAHMNMTSSDIVCSQQTHTTNVRKVTALDKGKGVVCERDYTDVDGLITNEKGTILATFYADCVPLFIVDPVHQAIGLSHSGWRGTAGRMGKVTLAQMHKEYGTKPEEVRVAIAPSICQHCYEVSEDVAAAFEQAFQKDDAKAAEYLARYQQDFTQKELDDCLVYQKENGKYQLNLWYANFRVFRDAGVPDEKIEVTDVCTCCNPELLFSHRASKGRRGNLGAFLMLKNRPQRGECMGYYLNPDNKGFWKAVRSKIYVDKTGLIACTNELINTEQQYICVSRPRRFGKSMALKMLAAYYSRGCDSTKLFQGRKIENADTFYEHLNQYDVIFLNMQQFLIEAESEPLTKYLEREVLREFRCEYGACLSEQELGLAAALRRIYVETGRQFILLIDEWDCVMRERQESEAMQKQYLDFLRNLIKDQPYIALAYVTGILPVKKYGEHSALNMFTEYSMTEQDILEEYTGFTEPEVAELCDRFSMDFHEMSSWYDGYRFATFRHIYNPQSVVEAMRRHKYLNYWTATEAYDALKVYIDMDFDGLRADIVHMLGGGCVRVNTRSFQNDMRNFKTKDDVLTLLIHLGYLGYDAMSEEAFIPNKEIIMEFENAMSVGGWSEIINVLKASEKLLEDTLRCDEKSVAEGLDKAHTEVASILTYNDENSLGCAIGLAYYSARKDYKLIREFPAGKGFADIVFLPQPHTAKPALVVELKYQKTAHTAIQQIKDRNYVQALEGYVGDILLVGISYKKDCTNKPHHCVIERIQKESKPFS